MRTDFDLPNQYLVGPVVFRPDFNAQTEVMSENQLWSLLFMAGQEDKAPGFNAEADRFFTNVLVSASVAGVLWGVVQ